MQWKKHKFLALELLLLTKSDNLKQIWEKFCCAEWKCTKKLMWYTYEVCNKINLLKNVEKEVLMYSQIENSLLSNVVTKSNLQMRYLSPILRMLISELKVHFFRCNFSHILILTQPVWTLFLFKSIWMRSQGSQGCQKIRFFFYK